MRMLLFMVAGATALVIISCTGPHRGIKMDDAPLEEKENLVYLDSALTAAIPCRDLKCDRLPSGRLKVWAQFYNRQDHTAECAIKLRFKDDDARIVDETSWMPLVLPRRQLTQTEHTSLTTEATDFVLMLRMAEKDGPDE